MGARARGDEVDGWLLFSEARGPDGAFRGPLGA